MTVRSPAKINWTLRVIGRRADGYHEIESLVSAITLYDELTFEDRVDSEIELLCDHAELPTDDRNLIVRAIRLFAGQAGVQRGVTCRLSKRIPIGGGLGGGSSNAATTLSALNRVWSLDWPTDKLMPLAAALGSDVPFFLHGGSVIMRGRGERIETVQLKWGGWIAMLMPNFSVSTAAVYRAWQPQPATKNETVPQGNDAVAWMQQTFNMLEEPACQACPELRGLLDGATQLSGRSVRLSGSGSSVFTAFDTQSEAEQFARRAEQSLGVRACVVQLDQGLK